MKKISKIFATLLAVALMASSFAACRLIRDADEVKKIREEAKQQEADRLAAAELKEMMGETAITINDDITVDGAYYAYFYSTHYSMQYSELSAAQTQSSATDAVETSDVSASSEAAEASSESSAASAEIVVDKAAVKKAAIDEIVELKTAHAKALASGIELTDADNENIASQVEAMKSQASSQGLSYNGMLSMMGTDEETVEQIIKEQFIVDRYYASLVADKYVTAKHILVMSTVEASGEGETATPARSAEESKALVDSIKAQLDGGADFDNIMNEKSEDNPTVNTHYTFAKNEMDPAFEAAAYELKPNEVSGIVESSYGYHIIKRMDTKVDEIMGVYANSADPDVTAVVTAEKEAIKASAKYTENAKVTAYFDTIYK